MRSFERLCSPRRDVAPHLTVTAQTRAAGDLSHLQCVLKARDDSLVAAVAFSQRDGLGPCASLLTAPTVLLVSWVDDDTRGDTGHTCAFTFVEQYVPSATDDNGTASNSHPRIMSDGNRTLHQVTSVTLPVEC